MTDTHDAFVSQSRSQPTTFRSLKSIGDFGTENGFTTQRGDIWHIKSGSELVEDFTCFLGRTGTRSYVDSLSARIEDLGIKFRVFQNSAGLTGVEAASLHGNRVEVADLDELENPVWRQQNEHSSAVTVASKWPIHETSRYKKLGSAGVRWGIVRITDAAESSRTVILAAEFTGAADNWKIRGGHVDVEQAPVSQQVQPTDS